MGWKYADSQTWSTISVLTKPRAGGKRSPDCYSNHVVWKMWASLLKTQEMSRITTVSPITSRKKKWDFILPNSREVPSFTKMALTMLRYSNWNHAQVPPSTNHPGISDGTEWKSFCFVKH